MCYHERGDNGLTSAHVWVRQCHQQCDGGQNRIIIEDKTELLEGSLTCPIKASVISASTNLVSNLSKAIRSVPPCLSPGDDRSHKFK